MIGLPARPVGLGALFWLLTIAIVELEKTV